MRPRSRASPHEVWVLAENLPVAAGNVDYPSPAQGFTLTAAEPLGVNRVILLVTRESVDGFSGDDTVSTAVKLGQSMRSRSRSSRDRTSGSEILAEILNPEGCDFGHRGRGWNYWTGDASG